jgi:hypothetical protein
MAPLSRRIFLHSSAAANITMLVAGCSDDSYHQEDERSKSTLGLVKNPYEFGAIGDGKNDDTSALQSAYEAALARGGGAVELTRGRFHIPGNVAMEHPGVSLVSSGGAVLGGGELLLGPRSYDADTGGVDFSGDCISGVTFDHQDDYGTARCLVLRNVRGLDIRENTFTSAGKGIAIEEADGNDKFHTTSMLRVSGNRFSKLVYGVYGDTTEWDRLSDWHITDNYFNFCSDTSVWIASTDSAHLGGVDGLDVAGNTMFSQNYNSSEEPLFDGKRYNVRLGQTNWLRIANNNFFEAGLSAVYLDTPGNFTFVGNHIAWPGQRELGDCLEIHNGHPRGVIEGNTFAMWTRAAIGLYDVTFLWEIEVGQNAWHWTESPASWKGTGPLPAYRVYASDGGSGYPIIRDFHVSGAYDDMKGKSRLQSRDVKTPKGGVTGASHRALPVTATITVFSLSDIAGTDSYGGLISLTATNSSDDSLVATYLLFVSSQGSVCNVIQSGGYIEGDTAEQPSFTWTLSGGELLATPVGSTNGTFNFDAVGIGAASLA